MKLTTRLFTSRKIALGAASFLSLVSIAAADAPYADANPFERSVFGDDWGVLSSDIFFGGAGAMFGLSPASRMLMLSTTSASKTSPDSNAIVDAAGSSENLFNFASSLGSPFAIGARSPVSGGGGITAPNAPTATELYWDADGNTSAATGGTGTWTTANTWRDGSLVGTLGNWVDGSNAHFNLAPGIVTVGTTVAPATAFFEVTGYTLQGAGTTNTVNGPVVLGMNANLFINDLTSTTSKTLEIGGSISGDEGSGITIQGAQTGSAHSRILLTLANSVISVPITIAKTGTGPAGVVGNAAGQQITGSITNNSTGSTLLGSNSGSLTVSGQISGTAGLRLSNTAAAAGGGSGTVLLTGNNIFTGPTVVATGDNGVAAVGSTTGQALGTTISVAVNSGTLRWDVSNQINNLATVTLNGGTMNLNGFSEGAAGTNGVGALTLNATSIINFGAGSSSIIQFSGVGSQTQGQVLQITNWNGVPVTGGSGDRLLFGGLSSSFTALYDQTEVSFNGVLGYEIAEFGTYYEVTQVPEPTTWIGAALALAAIGFTQWRRFAKRSRVVG